MAAEGGDGSGSGGGGGLFGTEDAISWGVATKAGGARAFRIKNLDTGQSFHVKNTNIFVDETKFTTFAPDADAGEGGSVDGRKPDAAAAPAARIANPGLTVKIISTEPRRDSEGRTFTAYVIRVISKAQNMSWLVVRRYRDFFELDRMIRSSPYRTALGSCELPKKKWFGSMTESVVRERQRQLQTYVDLCTRHLPADKAAAWATFVELNIKRTRTGVAAESDMTLKDATAVPGLMSLAEAADAFAEYRM